MAEYLQDVFGAGGHLAQHFESYVPREGQRSMARAVDSALCDGRHLVVEGPTGTGKGIAYLVPAIHHATHGGGQVVITTANIALQEQLVTKDLPLLADVLPWSFTYALMKGRNNYLCRERYWRELPRGTELIPAPTTEMDMIRAIRQWAEETTTGDVSELPFEPPGALWRRFSTPSDDCRGSACRCSEVCFACRARERARQAKVIVCNYHLLFAHLVVREATHEDLVLPSFDVAVLDEAHKATDIAREFFGFRVTSGSIHRIARLLPDWGATGLQAALRREADAFFEALGQFHRSKQYRVRLRVRGPAPSAELIQLLRSAAGIYEGAMESAQDDADKADLRRLSLRSRVLAEQVQEAMTLADSNAVYFLEEDRRGRGVLRSKPVDVSSRLRTQLFEQARTVVVTSATLSVGGSFSLVKSDLGVPEPREVVVESPFDHAEQSILVVPTHLPEPNDPAFPAVVSTRVRQIAELAGGRTLGLFTSYRNLNRTRDRMQDTAYRVFSQGERPRTDLVQAFRDDTDSVLLGTESFWAGVDVPGAALSCVIIDRLPFPTPNDPVLDAIRERDRQWFQHHGLPRAIIAFKQGVGRLIRSEGDRGVVVVLDRRLVTKPYGRLFLASLPAIRTSRRIEDVQAFLDAPANVAQGA